MTVDTFWLFVSVYYHADSQRVRNDPRILLKTPQGRKEEGTQVFWLTMMTLFPKEEVKLERSLFSMLITAIHGLTCQA